MSARPHRYAVSGRRSVQERPGKGRRESEHAAWPRRRAAAPATDAGESYEDVLARIAAQLGFARRQ